VAAGILLKSKLQCELKSTEEVVKQKLLADYLIINIGDGFLNIKDNIIDFARSIGVEKIGFCDTNFSNDFVDNLLKRKELNMISEFEEHDINKRVNISDVIENASTIISIALPYRCIENVKNSPYFSKASFGLDYHRVAGEKLKRICEYITENFNGKCIYFCDTGPLHDREIAKKSGIGFYGKNSCIVNPKFGSFIFLGEIITDIFIERDREIEGQCGDCDLCIKACPVGAIEEPYTINYRKCLSYVTQKKDDLSDNEAEAVGFRLYGCDTCQDVCPMNKAASLSEIDEFAPEMWNLYPDPIEILSISNSEFKNTFKKTSSGWRGKKNLQRNMIIALGNSKNKKFIPFLKKDFSDINLNKYAQRAIKKLEG
jgi:epoxyqueuosine reductase